MLAIYKEILGYITDFELKQILKETKNLKDKNVAYNRFLRTVNIKIYGEYIKKHDMELEENEKAWKSFSNYLRDEHYSFKKFNNNSIPLNHDNSVPLFKTHDFNSYEHLLYLNIDEVLTKLRQYYQLGRWKRQETKNQFTDIQGLKVKLSGLKLQTFLNHGQECSCCKTKGSFFTVSKSKSEFNIPHYHLSLWGIGENNELVLFTHDHTLARGLGGKDKVSNTTTMCYKCNNLKSLEESRLANELRHKERQIKQIKEQTEEIAKTEVKEKLITLSPAILKHHQEAMDSKNKQVEVVIEAPKRKSGFLRMNRIK